MGRVKDKVVLLTGASGGMGAAIARLLTAEGAAVTMADVVREPGLATAAEIGGDFLDLDVTNEERWQEVVEAVVSKHGRIDVLVNTAGIEGDATNGSPETTSLEEWHRVLRVNLDGTFLGCKHVLPIMMSAQRGSIINISSIVSTMGTPSMVAYGASKAGVEQLTKSIALHVARAGTAIRCNSVHPGEIRTRMLENIQTEIAKSMGAPLEEVSKAALALVPFGRVGEPADVAYQILYLASDESQYVTGSALLVDGGWHIGQAG